MKAANSILSSYGVTVFETISRLAIEHDAINLGQGFPDEDGPEILRQIAAQATLEGPNQYPPMLGIPELRQAVAIHNKRFYNLEVDWQTEVMVTSGATEALADCMLALIEPGDEVVLIEPLYDCYLPMVRRAGGVPRLVRIDPPHWELPRDALRNAFSEKTKLILLNTPHNPAAKVYTEDELSFIAELVEENDAYAVCDEVYEHITFDDSVHRPLMTFSNMRDRCVRIGSAGKTFSMTSWKVGYLTAPAHLLGAIAKAHQFVTFTTPSNLQRAVATGLLLDDRYFSRLALEQQAKRDRIDVRLKNAGFSTLSSEGTYFLTVDIRSIGFQGTDIEFCEHLICNVGVAAIPISAFYQDAEVRQFVRFCFCKKDKLLDTACLRLARHFQN
ncbi:MAG: aminotransferase [Rhodospirillaceae bacterium TMED8]|nr:aminotransferase [Magnetovibrio sp.]OUT51537.1 MAG: aminotransferase [Rhodospirillaceae bacterium TMED8]